VSSSGGALARLERYGAMLLESTSRINLTGARTEDAVAEQIADAFDLVPLIGGRLIDVGSGGGLPGIPLAILTGQPVVLIDATAKKVAFLARALEALEIRGEAILGRAESLGHRADLREHFRHATARAVASAPTVAELTLPFLEIGGTALLQRGTLDDVERNALADAVMMLGGTIEDELAVAGARRIVVVRKSAPTPPRFPRRVGIPAKRPLCLSS